ncbi:conserved membrane protein of unknown function [Tenacibaculum sp. 190130A14a]|uniref:Mechanosensitive ion channel n=1 Tax=Tenacibaculum polynesiense TaxID=3137857 RepID=A0ABM9PC12_9FLAO
MKNELTNWPEVFKSSFYSLWEKITQSLPNIAAALLVICIGIIVARIISKIISALLTKFGNTKMGSVLSIDDNKYEEKSKTEIIALFSKFSYWIVVLFFLVVSSNVLGWTIVSQEIGELFRYIPKLLSGIIIVIIGLYIARFIKHTILKAMSSLEMSGSKALSSMAFYIVLIFVVITALNQIGVDTLIINQNLTIIIASTILSFAIAFGFASRNILESFISGSYSRKNLEIGTEIIIDGFQGEIVKVDAVTFNVDNGKTIKVFPLKILTNINYEIIKK